MAKSIVKAEQKKRRISKSQREELADKEDKFNSKLRFIDIKPPKYLNKKEKTLFKKYINIMQDLNILSVLDADILGHYVIFANIFNELREQLDNEGYVISGKINPILGEMRQISKTMASFQVKLGLNPTDRLRFIKNEPIENDELEDFINEV
ncbi:MAG: phage terminase small subunit P27 family [Clostridia bacterium]